MSGAIAEALRKYADLLDEAAKPSTLLRSLAGQRAQAKEQLKLWSERLTDNETAAQNLIGADTELDALWRKLTR